MNERQTTIPLPDGSQATLTLPAPVTPEALQFVEEALSAYFRRLRGEAQALPARDAGALEYESWRAAA